MDIETKKNLFIIGAASTLIVAMLAVGFGLVYAVVEVVQLALS